MIELVLALWLAGQSTASVPASACSVTTATGVSGAAAEICLAEQAFKQSETDERQRERLIQSAGQHYRRAVVAATSTEDKIRSLEGLERVYDSKHLQDLDQVEQVLREIIALRSTELDPVFRLAKVQEERGFLDAAENTLLGVSHEHPLATEPLKRLAQLFARRATALYNSANPMPVIGASGVGQRDENGVYRVGGAVDPPMRVGVPQYPPEAKAAGIQGTVIVEVVVSESGLVTDAKVVRSIPLLDDAALRAVREWRFHPTMINGQAVPVRMTTTVNFTQR
jgi:TonB family protein